MIKLLIGGSPCTHWSIAQTKNRETEAEGLGWELFNCYLTAKEKFQPDYFLYENNQSAAEPIKNQISECLGEPLHYINSSLLSAQSRKRFYVHNFGNIGQPEDRGLVVKDILDEYDDEIHYDLVHVCKPKRDLEKYKYDRITKIAATGPSSQGDRVYGVEGKSCTISANGGGRGANTGLYTVPVKLGDIGRKNQGYCAYDSDGKACTVTANGGGLASNTNAYVVPVKVGDLGKEGQGYRIYDPEGKACTVTAGGGGLCSNTNAYAVPVKLGDTGKKHQGYTVYDSDGKARTQTAQPGGRGVNTGLYVIPVNGADTYSCPVRIGDIQDNKQDFRVYSPYGKSATLNTYHTDGRYIIPVPNENPDQLGTDYEAFDGNDVHIIRNVHIVENKQIETKLGRQTINLPDGGYIVRKLKPVECERLQTLPDGYTDGISKTQRYKCIGNGWTAEVIKFILQNLPDDKDEEIVVLSMFDGIATGRYVLDQLGYKNVKYYAYEIDPYAIKVAKKNWPDIIELGDVFQIHDENWSLPESGEAE